MYYYLVCILYTDTGCSGEAYNLVPWLGSGISGKYINSIRTRTHAQIRLAIAWPFVLLSCKVLAHSRCYYMVVVIIFNIYIVRILQTV